MLTIHCFLFCYLFFGFCYLKTCSRRRIFIGKAPAIFENTFFLVNFRHETKRVDFGCSQLLRVISRFAAEGGRTKRNTERYCATVAVLVKNKKKTKKTMNIEARLFSILTQTPDAHGVALYKYSRTPEPASRAASGPGSGVHSRTANTLKNTFHEAFDSSLFVQFSLLNRLVKSSSRFP